VIGSLDLHELPTLVNVLMGDMALVGPSPTTPERVAEYGPQQRKLLSMRPGVASFSAVYPTPGVSDETLDLEYVERWTLLLNARIIGRTTLLGMTRWRKKRGRDRK